MSTAAITADSAVTKRLFPLHLTPFEDFMLWDDQPDYPMAFLVQLSFRGKIIPAAFESAVESALAMHPLLRSNIKPGKQGLDCWALAADQTIPIEYLPLDKPLLQGKSEGIDLRANIGVRMWVQSDDDQTIISTQFHHATCDGIGSYQFLGDVLWYYNRNSQYLTEDYPEPVVVNCLRNRGRVSYQSEFFKNAKGKPQTNYIELFKLAITSIIPLANPKTRKQRLSHAEMESLFPGIKSFEFDKDQYKTIRLAAEERGLSTNDFLLEQLFVTMQRWNRDQGAKSKGRFCIMLPMDLREAGTELRSAANAVTYTFLRRYPKDLAPAEKLISSLREEMIFLKRDRHRTPFMNLLTGARRYSAKLKQRVFSRRCLATAILSNTGDPTKRFNVPLPREGGLVRAGNLTLIDIQGVPPMRANTKLTVSIFTYRRVLKLCMRCDPHYFSLNDTQNLLDLYIEAISTSVSGKQPRTS